MCVLGSMLLDPVEACGIGVELLDEDDFYLPSHRIIFNEITNLFNSDIPADVVLLRERLEKSNTLEKAGGTEYLFTLLESVPTSANITYYANIVRSKSILRKLIETTNDIQRKAYEEAEESETILESSEQAIFEIAKFNKDIRDLHIKPLISDAFDQAFSDEVRGIDSGFIELDGLTGGFKPGQLIIVAGRPGMGKTTFALNILRYIAVQESVPVALYSLEMSGLQVAQNILSAQAKVRGQQLRGGKYKPDPEETRKLMDAAEKLSNVNIFIDDRPGLTPLSIKARARRLKASKDIGLLVVDYLQLMESPSHSKENRQQEISYISRSLKALARDLQIPIIALCQLSRGPEARDDRRPRLSDLRESGAIEQDADMVILLFREEYYFSEREEAKNVAEANLAKHRNGETRNKIRLQFFGEYLRFENPAFNISDNDISYEDIAD